MSLQPATSPPPVRYTRKGMKGLARWVEKREAARRAEAERIEAEKEMEELQGKPPKPPRLFCYGRKVDPTITEKRLLSVRWVKDVGVTARGKGEERRLVAFIVLEEGRLLRDVELDLQNAASSLPAWGRPQAYSQVAALPRDPVLGRLKRHLLKIGRFDDRTFHRSSGRYRGWRGITAVIRNAINEVQFEGIVSKPVEQRRSSDPPGKVRQNEARLTVSHRPPGDTKRVTVTFNFRGAAAKKVLELQVGERVVVTGRISTDDRTRVFMGASFARVDKSVERVTLNSTDSVIEALL